MDRRSVLKAMALTASGLVLPAELYASLARARVTDIRRWSAPDHTRVVFDLDNTLEHALFRLHDPERVVLDLQDAQFNIPFAREKITDSVIKDFRLGNPRRGVTRIVFEVGEAVRPRSFLLKPTANKSPRLVVDLYRISVVQEKGVDAEDRHKKQRKSVIVIDPGHGGEDPGAIGPLGTKEKDVALAVARKMVRIINKESGYRAYLTRTGDYYVSLKKRVSLARSYSPDMFISLHADAFRDGSARGASVYCLSEKGKPDPDRAISDLVARENSADLIGGVNLSEDYDPEVAGILMDLSQRDSLKQALRLGDHLLDTMHSMKRLRIHFKRVKQAGFAVLKAPDLPSVLVEMAFLTNPGEEKNLRRPDYQHELAQTLFKGAKKYIKSTRRA
ncbi:MAG: N-acetylmuramoyl-L-alanine amidase [Magnetococcales bacterium]|nr:N-acetylmuramoyl-L-alanine amidase [Magnetococcales bacterium]